MSWVYILKSLKDGRYYVGSTTDLARRFAEHSRGDVRSTKAFLPFQLVFKQEFSTYAQARRLELRLKKYKRRDFLEKIIRDGEILRP